MPTNGSVVNEWIGKEVNVNDRMGQVVESENLRRAKHKYPHLFKGMQAVQFGNRIAWINERLLTNED